MPGWTPDEVDTLVRMRRQGSTAAQIAAEMPPRTRDAVLGRLHRMGLCEKQPVLTPEERRKRRRERQAQAERNRAAARRAQKPRAPAPRPADPVYVPNPHFQPVRPVRFLDSAFFQCSFILDADAPIEERMVCAEAAQDGSSYCPHHHAICWTKAPPRPPRNPQANHVSNDPRRRSAFVGEGV